jgi:hypothetical protein
MRTIVVVGRNPSDARVEATREAVQYWNGVFAELGLHQPFDAATFLQQEIPQDMLAAYSRSVLEGEPRPTTPVEHISVHLPAFSVYLRRYSYRSATIGSTLVARRAGTMLARTPTMMMTMAIVAKIRGSRVCP